MSSAPQPVPSFFSLQVLQKTKTFSKKLPTSLSCNLSHGGNKWLLTEAGAYQCVFTLLAPLESLGIIVSKNTFLKVIREFEESHHTDLDTGLDEIIGHALFPKYLKCEQTII